MPFAHAFILNFSEVFSFRRVCCEQHITTYTGEVSCLTVWNAISCVYGLSCVFYFSYLYLVMFCCSSGCLIVVTLYKYYQPISFLPWPIKSMLFLCPLMFSFVPLADDWTCSLPLSVLKTSSLKRSLICVCVLTAVGLRWCMWAFSSCFGWWLLCVCGVRALHCGGSSFRSTGSRCMGLSSCSRALERCSVIVECGLSCSAACGIFPDQGWNPCPLHYKADS